MPAEFFRSKEKEDEEELFPISAAAVFKALVTISKDPSNSFAEEQKKLSSHNPTLEKFIIYQTSGFQDTSAKREFLEGALWTHRILRFNLKTSENLPMLSEDMMGAFHDATVVEDPGKSFKRICAEKMAKLGGEEEHLARAMRQFTQYRTSNVDFYFGAYVTMGNFKKYDEIRELKKSLGM